MTVNLQRLSAVVALAFSVGAFTITSPTAQGVVMASFADVAERAIPGVVNIRATQLQKRPTNQSDPYQFFLKGRLPRSATTHSLGSGVIINKKGHILTNYHVVNGATNIEILFAQSKRKLSAKIVGMDAKTDLALLRVGGNQKISPLDLGNSDRLRVGDVVLAIGNPFGFSHTVTSGIISAKGRVIGTGPFDNFLQTDAPIHPGNSGGPLIDTRGRVIGITTAISTEGAGIGFAIPINMAQQVVKDLLAHGKVIRPWMGVVGKNILSLDDVGDGFDPSGVYGVIVSNLIIDGPAVKAGLRMGDLIMGANNKKVYDMNQLQRILGDHKPADSLRLKVYRRNKGFVYPTITLRETPKAQDLPAEKDLF